MTFRTRKNKKSKKWGQMVSSYSTSSNSVKQWFVAINLFVILTLFFVWYNITQGDPGGLESINSANVISALVMIILSFMIIPLAQITGYFGNYTKIYRPLRIVGYASIVLHAILAFILTTRNNIILENNIASLVSGLIVVALICIIWFFSYRYTVKFISAFFRKVINKLNHYVILIIILHLYFLRKLQSCEDWILHSNHTEPPPIILIVIILYAILIGLIIYSKILNKKRS